VIDTPLQDDIILLIRAGVVEIEHQFAVIQLVISDSTGLKRFEEQLFLDTNARA
jgi:hypothetical protein